MAPSISIIGAGPGGLTLAVLLHKRGVPVTIYELRGGPDEEAPRGTNVYSNSGMLDLHEESGQAALKEAGLHEQFLALTGECSEVTRVTDGLTGTIVFDRVAHGTESRPEIARHDLNTLLLSALPPTAIKWNHKLVSASRSTTPSGAVEISLDFGPQGVVKTDLVVGADGAWSKIRNDLISDAVQPYCPDFHGCIVNIPDCAANHPELMEVVGRGTCAAMGNRNSIHAQPGPQGSLRVYMLISAPADALAAYGEGTDPTTIKNAVLSDPAFFAPFADAVKRLITVGFDTAIAAGRSPHFRRVYILPAGWRWFHRPRGGATIIGDAAHLMLPFAGQGVNMAMWDALELSHVIADAYADATSPKLVVDFHHALDPKLERFETIMMTRSNAWQKNSLDRFHIWYGVKDGARAMKEFFEKLFLKTMLGPEKPE